jgi:ABC-type Fe3+ transport system substrate-binding protein
MIDRRTMLGLSLASPLFFRRAAASAQDLDALYERARPEGALHIYTGGVASNSAGTIKAFNARFPGIPLTVTGDYSNVNDIKIDRQLAEKRVDADVVSFQTVQDFVRWKRMGVLQNFKPDGIETVGAEFKDPDGAFVATNVNPLSYGYNPTLVAAGDVPKSALDFLKPQFHGKLVTCYPADDDATLFLFHTLAEKYGWTFVEHYMATEPAFVQGHLGVLQWISAGRRALTFDCSTHTGTDLKAAGQPIEVVFSAVDPTPIFYNTSGIMRDAPHPNAAKLYVNWTMSREQQIGSRNWSARSDVPPPTGMKPLSGYTLASGYREFLVNTKLVNDLRARFLAFAGPPVNLTVNP